jgi:hypothetical protein
MAAHDALIYSIKEFPTYELEVDFTDPDAALAQAMAITNEVEQECPVGKAFGVTGCITGEGVVWTPSFKSDPHWIHSRYWFKTKGTEGQSVHKAPSSMLSSQSFDRVHAFLEKVVTVERCQQGYDFMKEMRVHNDQDQRSMNNMDAARWVLSDVLSEVLSEEMGEIRGVLKKKHILMKTIIKFALDIISKF